MPDSSSTTAAPAAPADPLAHYPPWASDLARRYFTKTINQFVLHGNVRDLVPADVDAPAGSTQRAYLPLRQFLSEDLFAGRDLVVFYDRSDGIHFMDAESRRDFARAVSGYDSLFGTDFAKRMPKDPPRVFALLDNYFRLRLADGKRVACVIDYAETVVPMSEAASYSTEDRAALVTLQKWAHDPTLLRADFTLVLIAENLNDLSRPFVQSPYNAELNITLPDQDQRTQFIEWFLSSGGPSGTDARARYAALSDVPDLALAQNTAGLGYVQLRSILADVLENERRLTFETLSDKKKELIEAEAYGLLEFVESPFGLDSVAGHTEAKEHLRAAAAAIKSGRPDVMPMGYLVNGPVGTGKTFLITSFAAEIGIPMVMLKNFRSQWQGVTEGNLEKILGLLRAMNPVAVMIDEADAALGDRSSQGDSGVSSRVFGQIAQAMSDTRFRGKIIWFLVTARPDLMPVDLKRQGRAEEHIALFYPATIEDKNENTVYPVRIDDEIPGKVKILSIEPTRVIFVNTASGRREFVDLPDLNVGTSISIGAPTGASKGRGAGIEQLSPGQYNVSRTEIDKALSDMNKILTEARAIPHIENGVPSGFKLIQIVPGSIYDKLGLKDNDVLCGVDGDSINDPGQAFALLASLKTRSALELCVKRGGKMNNFSYLIR